MISHSDENGIGATPNPKAAALAAEDAEKKSTPIEVKEAALPTAKKPEAVSSSGTAGDARLVDAAKPQPPDVKKDTKNAPASAKGSDKDSSDKKKTDEKDKKKGGFLRVFKKIFAKTSLGKRKSTAPRERRDRKPVVSHNFAERFARFATQGPG
jgi:hypothetical protein